MIGRKIISTLAVPLVVSTLLACSVDHEPDRADIALAGRTLSVTEDDIDRGPIRHEQLTDDQMARIVRLQRALAEVDPSSLDKWVDDFRRDIDPEGELCMWEEIARVYQETCVRHALRHEEKAEVFHLLLTRSSFPSERALREVELRHLSDEIAREVMEEYSLPPELPAAIWIPNKSHSNK